jgi:hypothetical protein
MHLTHLGAEVATTYVLITLFGFEPGLYTHYAFPFDFAVGSVAVEDVPMAAQKLDREGVVVLDGDPVGKHELPRKRIAVIRLVKRFHADFNSFRDS